MALFNVRQFFGTLYQRYMFSLPAIHFSRTQKVRINCRLFEVIVNTLIICTFLLHNDKKDNRIVQL